MLRTTQKVSKHYDCDNDDDNNRKIIKNNNNKKLSNFLISITSHLYCLEKVSLAKNIFTCIFKSLLQYTN